VASDPKISLVIPYRRRLNSLRSVFCSLTEQTMDPSEFEIVVGAIGYDPDYVAMCAQFIDRLSIITVMTGQEWNVCRARNNAIRQVSGEVTVLLDADIVVPSDTLGRLYREYYAGGSDVCVLGQAVGYSDELSESDVPEVDDLPYSHYRPVLDRIGETDVRSRDARWGVEPVLPWTMVWGGLTALRTDTLRRYDLTFDEGFRGWGLEDQEWGYRVQLSGTPIVFAAEIYGLHLPHVRDLSANQAGLRRNSWYFTAKWPTLDVELLRPFGWKGVNEVYHEARAEVAAALGDAGASFGALRGPAQGGELLVLGAVLDAKHRPVNPRQAARFSGPSRPEILPLTGFSLPCPDQSAAECRILPPIRRLSPRFREVVRTEAERVARKVLDVGEDGESETDAEG
jgi:Glycosyl transferase family 2